MTEYDGEKRDLLSLYRSHKGKVSDKWLSYLIDYSDILKKFRNYPVRILEIGIQNGGSLEIWAKFFPNAELIVGCDINPLCENLTYSDDRIKVIVGDANDQNTYSSIMVMSEKYDIIIDDGSHMSSDIIRSFARYFPRLSEGGLFIAEDLHCSYWGSFEGGIEAPYSAVNFFKRVADYVNLEHWGQRHLPAEAMLSYFADFWGEDFDGPSLQLIKEIRFLNSLVVVSRGREGENLLGPRVVAGQLALVEEAVKDLEGMIDLAPDQSLNKYGPDARRIESMTAAFEQVEEENTRFSAALNEANSDILKLNTSVKLAKEELRNTLGELTKKNQLIEDLERQREEVEKLRNIIESGHRKILLLENEYFQMWRRPDLSILRLFRHGILKLFSKVFRPLSRDMSEIFSRSAKRWDPRWKFLLDNRISTEQTVNVHSSSPIPVIKNAECAIQRIELDLLVRDRYEENAQVNEVNSRLDTLNGEPARKQIKKMIKNLILSVSAKLPRSVKSLLLKSNAVHNVARRWKRPLHVANIVDSVAENFLVSKRAGSVTGDIKFSILVPVYNTPPHLLRRCLDTVLFQSWANWELLIVDDASPAADVRLVLDEYVARDNRIFVQHLEHNLGISGASQRGLNAATGDYVVLLDHDDELTYNALEAMAAAIDAHPEAGVFYSDECILSPDGVPVQVYAKPDWSPSLMINCMYIGHLTVYRRSLVLGVGGFRSEYDFSQDYDLALRVSETVTPIIHVPKVLYGWRAIAESAAGGGKPFARKTNIAALQAAADRRGWKATAVAGEFANELRWETGPNDPKISLIVPSDNGEMITQAIKSISLSSSYENYEVLVVTNSALIAQLRQRTWLADVVFVPYDKPFNFSDKCNVGAAAANGEYFVFYNDDVRVQSPEWMERILDAFRIEGVGAVGTKLLYENNTIQHAGMVTGVRRLVGTAFHTLPDKSPAYFNYAQSMREVSLLCGALLAVHRNVFFEVGGFDAVNTPIYHSDVDLCFRIRETGMTCLYTPHATLLHIGHASIGVNEKKQKKVRADKAGVWMLKRWPEMIAYDPYFPSMMRDLCFHDSPEPYHIYPGKKYLESAKGDALLVSHDLSGSGAPRVVLEMARALQDEGWFVVVAAPSDGAMRPEFERSGITVIIEPLLFHNHPSVADFAKDYDIVICNTIVSWPLAAQLEGVVPVAMYVHEIELVDHLANIQPEFKSSVARMNFVWAGSNLCAEKLRNYCNTVSVLEYGVDPFPKIKRSSAENRNIRLAVFGSFEPRKGQDLMAEAFSSLSEDERRNVELHFFGRILDETMHKSLIERFSDVSGLHFHGELEHDVYVDQLSTSDMVIIPSRNDTLPLVSLNALSTGIPLMCTSQTGTSSYLVDGQSGYIIDEPTVPAIVSALRRSLADQARWEEVGKSGELIFEAYFNRSAFQERLVSKINERIEFYSADSVQ
ncbi:glycosyltransferase [Brucella anthropi]|uniref:glycosyltransferase n=1 Tax=Brucella anthropi TaxID=529 RepID=UPI003EDEE224